MAKKKSRQIVKKGGKQHWSSVFDCPKCSHSQCVEIKLRRTESKANLHCRVCGTSISYRINKHMKEVHVFCKWKDELEYTKNHVLGLVNEND